MKEKDEIEKIVLSKLSRSLRLGKKEEKNSKDKDNNDDNDNE